jgi:hypothetical protein
MNFDLGSAAVGYMVGSSSCDDSSSNSSYGGRINLIPIVLMVLSGILTYYFADNISSFFDISSYLGLVDNGSSPLSSVAKVVEEMMSYSIVFCMILIVCSFPYIIYKKIQFKRGM